MNGAMSRAPFGVEELAMSQFNVLMTVAPTSGSIAPLRVIV